MLQFITHQTPRFGIIEGAVAALNGGCKWIQLRMKGAPIEAVRQTAQQLIPLCKEHEAILVLDDYAQLAADLDIDGVHLGKLDMPVSEARLLIGEKYIIGGTANTFEDIQGLVRQDADYIGLGLSGIALSGTILQAEDPEKETKKIIDLLNKYRKA